MGLAASMGAVLLQESEGKALRTSQLEDQHHRGVGSRNRFGYQHPGRGDSQNEKRINETCHALREIG
jgi:hypothetical protein